MTQYDGMARFATEEQAETFAKEVGSDSWGWEKNLKGEIVRWYVDFYWTPENLEILEKAR